MDCWSVLASGAVAGRPLRVERLLANLGYGKRREVSAWVKKGRVTLRDGGRLKVGDKVSWADVLLDEEELDPPSPLAVILHKPTGYVVTSPDDENIPDPVVYDLLPYRFGRRRPFLSCVGRLDKDTSGLLLLTDDGALLHRINSPKRGIWKVYEATLADPLTPKQAEAAARKFASGTLVLEGDTTPLLPASLERTGERTARVSICEGRYHQVRRMFAALGHKVVALHRVSVGGLTLGSLPESEWRHLTPQELDLVFTGPSAEEVLAPAASGSGSAAAAVERDGGASAGTSGRGEGEEDGQHLTKKEKKKGKKEDVRAARRQALSRRGGPAAASDGGDEEEDAEDVDVADVEILTLDDEELASLQGNGEDDEAWKRASGPRAGAARRRPRRAPTVRHGSVTDAPPDGLDEQLDPATFGISHDDEAADLLMSAGAGGGVRKYKDGARWRRRRDALRQQLPS
ncbi:hypothetical protein GPECTOR_1g249 [Gonium pectorale]|uniref:Pseudouridine synthase RsuA/RluA-like domain-containing protein n=1 Tax=Gonium pectorale TaxID=33097 RepID=A0A150H2M8_GONPE|nr:hypothetical protein GPECTOR_1g249 [Gonium pectorale]|eukprot:KXZ56284.1 hypothetical protein GPECTOR_1g249 [Gonium pectorale]